MTPEQILQARGHLKEAGYSDEDAESTIASLLAEEEPGGVFGAGSTAKEGLRFTAGLAPAAGAVVGGLAAPALLERALPALARFVPHFAQSAIGQGIGTYFGGRLSGQQPKEALEGAIVSGGLGGAFEGALQGVGRGVASLTSIPAPVRRQTASLPTRQFRKMAFGAPDEFAELNLKQQAVGAVDEAMRQRPQLRVPAEVPTAEETQLEREFRRRALDDERARAVFRQSQGEGQAKEDMLTQERDTQRTRLQEEQNRALFQQGQSEAEAHSRMIAQKRSELAASRIAKQRAAVDVKEKRAGAVGRVGKEIQTHLYESERTLTSGRASKMALLKAAEAKGTMLDADELIQELNHLKVQNPLAPGSKAVNTAIDDFNQMIDASYRDVNGKHLVPPTEADHILRELRQVAGDSWKEIGGGAKQNAFKDAQRLWKTRIYDAISGSGEMSAQTKRMLDAEEALRGFVPENAPSTFASRALSGGPGSAERLAALREYESTHGTGGSLEHGLENLKTTYGKQLEQIGADYRSRMEAINVSHQARLKSIGETNFAAREQIGKGFQARAGAVDTESSGRLRQLREGNFAAREKIDKQFQSRRDALEREMQTRLDAATHKRAVESGDFEKAFAMKESGPVQQANFASETKLRSKIVNRKPEELVRDFTPGREDQETLAALRDFEDRHNTGGKIERDFRSLAKKRAWTGAEEGRIRSWYGWLEKNLGKPTAKGAILLSRPIGQAAAATAAFAQRMRNSP